MKYTQTSILTGKSHTMELPITEEAFRVGMHRRDGGDLIQDVFPELSDDHREFIMTGITPEEWGTLVQSYEIENQ